MDKLGENGSLKSCLNVISYWWQKPGRCRSPIVPHLAQNFLNIVAPWHVAYMYQIWFEWVGVCRSYSEKIDFLTPEVITIDLNSVWLLAYNNHNSSLPIQVKLLLCILRISHPAVPWCMIHGANTRRLGESLSWNASSYLVLLRSQCADPDSQCSSSKWNEGWHNSAIFVCCQQKYIISAKLCQLCMTCSTTNR